MPRPPADLNAAITAYISPPPILLDDQLTLGQALVGLQEHPLADSVLYLYVVNQSNQLTGIIPTRRALCSKPETPLKALCILNPLTVGPNDTIGTVCQLFVTHRYLALPVVDNDGVLIGTIDARLFTDRLDALSEGRVSEDVFQLIGIHVAQGRKVTTWQQFRDRFPWLLANIAGGIACAILAGWYEDVLAEVLALALFIPVVLALAESVSMQSMSLTVQDLHQGSKWSAVSRALAREAQTALGLGVACATIVASIAFMWHSNHAIAYILGLSIPISMLAASLLGVIFPTCIHHSGRDPRIASGPLVLASTDLITLTTFFTSATYFLRN